MQVCLYYDVLIVIYGLCTGCNVMPTQREANCLVRVISYSMDCTEDRHFETRLSTINKMNGSITKILSWIYDG